MSETGKTRSEIGSWRRKSFKDEKNGRPDELVSCHGACGVVQMLID